MAVRERELGGVKAVVRIFTQMAKSKTIRQSERGNQAA
jgi:hypothetical protein